MAQTKGAPVQDPFLNILRKEHIPVSIFLVNGIKLQGQIDSYDQFVILLKNAVNQMIYKHAISTIVPAKSISIPMDDQGDGYWNAITRPSTQFPLFFDVLEPARQRFNAIGN